MRQRATQGTPLVTGFGERVRSAADLLRGPYKLHHPAREIIEHFGFEAEIDLHPDTVDYAPQMVESGLMNPTAYPRARTAFLVTWSLGNPVLGPLLERLLGLDAVEALEHPTKAGASLHPMLGLMHDGVMTDATFEPIPVALFTGKAMADEGKEVAS